MRSRPLLATALFAATAAGGSALIAAGTMAADQPSGAPATVATSTSATSVVGGAGVDPGSDSPSSPSEAGATEVVVLPGDAPHRPDPGPDRPLGSVTPGLVPSGLDLSAFPSTPGAPKSSGLQGADSFSAGWGCAVQCVTSGVAYARGFGAQLVVETSVEADLFLSVIGDTDDDGDWDFSRFEYSDGATTHMAWALDDLDPGQTYYVMVSAMDSEGGHSLAYGDFTTLSQRDVVVTVGDVELTGGVPSDDVGRYLDLGWGTMDVTPGRQGILLFKDVERTLDAHLTVTRGYPADNHWGLCEASTGNWLPGGHGYDASSCYAWSSTDAAAVDLDTPPGGQQRWTSTEVHVDLHSPTGAGGALPNGYGENHFFHVAGSLSFWVSYS